jgi:hypothetical protein
LERGLACAVIAAAVDLREQARVIAPDVHPVVKVPIHTMIAASAAVVKMPIAMGTSTS